MTIQTKHFIETSDIVSARFECNKCRATFAVAISPEIRVDTLMMCPNCSCPWLGIPGKSDIAVAVKDFVNAVAKMARVLREWNTNMKILGLPGFSFTLEIRESPKEPS